MADHEHERYDSSPPTMREPHQIARGWSASTRFLRHDARRYNLILVLLDGAQRRRGGGLLLGAKGNVNINRRTSLDIIDGARGGRIGRGQTMLSADHRRRRRRRTRRRTGRRGSCFGTHVAPMSRTPGAGDGGVKPHSSCCHGGGICTCRALAGCRRRLSRFGRHYSGGAFVNRGLLLYRGHDDVLCIVRRLENMHARGVFTDATTVSPPAGSSCALEHLLSKLSNYFFGGYSRPRWGQGRRWSRVDRRRCFFSTFPRPSAQVHKQKTPKE